MKYLAFVFTSTLLLASFSVSTFAETTIAGEGAVTPIKVPNPIQEQALKAVIKPTISIPSKSTSSMPTLGINNLPEISTTTLVTLTHQEIKRYESKLDTINEEYKTLHLGTPVHTAVLAVYNSLTSASLKTETLIGKLDAILLKRQAAGVNMTSIISKEDEAKINLNTANRSLTTLSTLIESFMGETSTSSYKKLAQTKKNEFHLAADSAKKNIKSANDTIKQALAEMRQNLAPEETINATTSSDIKRAMTPLSPSPEVLQGSNK